MGGPQGGARRVRKISPPPGFDPQSVQLVASRHTNRAIAPQVHILKCNINKNISFLFSVIFTRLLHTRFPVASLFSVLQFNLCLSSAICSLFLTCRPSSLENGRRYCTRNVVFIHEWKIGNEHYCKAAQASRTATHTHTHHTHTHRRTSTVPWHRQLVSAVLSPWRSWFSTSAQGICGRQISAWTRYSPGTSVFNLSLSFYLCSILINLSITDSRDGAVGTATCYRLGGPGIELRWRRDIPRPSRTAVRPTQLPL